MTYSVRPPVPEDRTFVATSWRVSYRESVHNPGVARWIRKSAYGTAHDALVHEALNKAEVAICHDPEDASHILGWICWHASNVHYVYVKDAFRRRGIARHLLSSAFALGLPHTFGVTHKTPAGEAFLKALGDEVDGPQPEVSN